MSDDDSDYEPFGPGEEEYPDPDDDGYVTEPYLSGAEEEDDNYLGDDVDVDGLLQRMGAATGDGDSAPQAYQILRARHDKSRGKKGRKRADGASGVSSDDFETADDAEDEDWTAADDIELGPSSEPRQNKKKKKSQRGRRGPRQIELPEHISRMMGHANLLYASNKHQQAIDLLLEVIRSVPNLADPYTTLGTLHETVGKHKEALNFYMIAAHMTGNDVALWHKLAVMSSEQGYIRQAIYCWSKFLSKERDDFEARFTRAQLYGLIREGWKAKGQFHHLLEKEPGHPEVVKELARLYNEDGDPNTAIEMLETQLRDYYDKLDLTHINMLADLYINLGHHDNAVKLINRTEEVFCSQGDLPIDLQVRRGTCYLNIGDQASAQADLQQLLDHPVVEADVSYLDLYLLVVEQACKAGLDKFAVTFMDKIRASPELLEDPKEWQLVIDGYCRAERQDVAIDLYKARLDELGQQDERYFSTALALARLYVDIADTAAAVELLKQLDEQLALGAVSLPEGRGDQLALFIAKGAMHLELGQKEEFASCLMPHYTTLLQLAENNAAIVTAANAASSSDAVNKDLVKALKRRKMYARKGGRKGQGAAETESVFQGYVSRDRRKPHVAEADRAADRLLRRARAAGVGSGAVSGAEETDFEADDEDQQPQEEGDLPAELQALVAAVIADQHEIPDMFNPENTQLYGSFCDLVHVLLELGRNAEAEDLLKRAQAVSTFSATNREATAWWGPSALAGKKGKGHAKPAQGGAVSDGNLSDWAPAAAAPAAVVAGPGAAERREHVRKSREGIRLMQAEVLCKQGKVEEALKAIKSVLPKWPYSWRAWSLYCCVAGQAGRVQHWMKTVAALRAKHPDSLPLQVLAAHADNISGDQGPACQGYASALTHLRNEPLLMLCLGAAQIDAALARHCRDRNTALLRGFAALHTYAQHRGKEAEAEAAYNLGRAAHQVGLLHLAVAHYERVLQIDQEAKAVEQAAAATQQLHKLHIQQQQQQEADGMQLDGIEDHQKQQQHQKHQHGKQQQQLQYMGRQLVREAAHNLCLIYKGSGADDLARQIMRRYLTV